jgi:hypothetical protein
VIPLAYLQECHTYHEAFLDEAFLDEEFLDDSSEIKTKKLVLNGNVNIYENASILDDWLEQINEFVRI